jgi:NAD(P)-dependent dehydrogenase (short-subunit alcohol dehydrogenase family)
MMVDLRGKTFVIADANSGLGAATARAVACAEPGGYYGPKRLRGDQQGESQREVPRLADGRDLWELPRSSPA